MTREDAANILIDERQVPSVLVVEDDPFMQKVFTHVIKSIDTELKIDCVATGEEARFLIDEDANYEMIIADHFLLGNETGLDLWRHCKLTHPLLPFLVTSSMKPKQFLASTRRDPGIPIFLPKPFRSDECRQAIQRLLDRPETLPTLDLHLDRSRNTPFATLSRWLSLMLLSLLVVMPVSLRDIDREISSRSAPVVPRRLLNKPIYIDTSPVPVSDPYDYEIPIWKIRDQEILQDVSKNVAIIVARANEVLKEAEQIGKTDPK